MILIIDNFDSFVFNLSRYVEELGEEVLVIRNNRLTLSDIYRLHPTHIIISPGPCAPNSAGISVAVVHEFAGKIPIFGVCLGHQVIGHVFGGLIIKAKEPMHGKSCLIEHQGTGLFSGVPNPVCVGRYHSLIVSDSTLSREISITSRSPAGEIMSLSSKKLMLVGVQFHPESVMTQYGHQFISNFLRGII